MEPPPSAKVCDGAMKYYVGYYQSWADTRDCMAYGPENIDPWAWTHLHYAFGIIDSNLLCSVENGNFTILQRVVKLKQKNPNLKIVISIGGWTFQDPGSPTVDRFKAMMATKGTRAAFLNSVVSIFKTYSVDGLDIDWEYPGTPERAGSPADSDNYLSFIQEARALFGSTYSLSIAAPAGFWYLRWFKIDKMATYLDYIVFMTYDLHGNWDAGIPSIGGHLNAHNNMTEIMESITLMEKAGVKSNKILMGIGFYGRSFKMADANCYEPGCMFADPGALVPYPTDNYQYTATPGPCTNAGGTLAYFEIQGARNYSKRMEWQDDKAMTDVL
ncbi:hypothetical protein HDV00_003111 [Rhizophlyctis rosea]|nr:hypothetical protein HDV00_003111 [Rhizophlyctis rosea]